MTSARHPTTAPEPSPSSGPSDAGPHSPSRGEGREALTPAVELIGIDKRFGEVQANKGVNLAIERGTIHGIVGEKGAG